MYGNSSIFSLGAWNNYYYRFHTVEIPIAGLHEKIRGVYFLTFI